MKVLLMVFFISLAACGQSNLQSINYLEGIWKLEHKEQFEVWIKTETGGLEGYGYRMKREEKSITETLSIEEINGVLVYMATVPDQNNGATVPFTLNEGISDSLSFENLSHDFPKRIIYKKINASEIRVYVLGADNRGFNYILIRQ